MTSPVNVDVKLGVNKFNVDEDSPHIILKTDPDKQALEVLIKACPAGLYKKQDDGSVRFDYAGCLECGTCRNHVAPMPDGGVNALSGLQMTLCPC